MPDAPLTKRTQPLSLDAPAVQRELRELASFVRTFCHGKRHLGRAAFDWAHARVPPPRDAVVELCRDCAELLAYAVQRRLRCPYDPKPMCKRCPTHCYAAAQRERIREVMRYAGPRLLLHGRLSYLFKLGR